MAHLFLSHTSTMLLQSWKFMGLRLTQDCVLFPVADFARTSSVISLRASTFLNMFEENLCFQRQPSLCSSIGKTVLRLGDTVSP